ncbi:MAG: hypothetical protein ACJ76N_17970 [Thermoanaerobaculia bacterium]
MADPSQIILSVAVEGDLDEVALRRLLAEAGLPFGKIYGKAGKDRLRNRIYDYNNAARLMPWIVLVDLDREAECAASLCRSWLPEPAPRLMFRVAVRALEAWLLADGEAISEYLGVSKDRVPLLPDNEPDPKRSLVELARHSRQARIREAMTPSLGRRVGPLYSLLMTEFIERHWRPEIAAERSDSLRRCRLRLRELARSG